MGRKRKETEETGYYPEEEESEQNNNKRLIGAVSRTNPDLYSYIKSQAIANGMSVGEYLDYVIRMGLDYSKYSDITGDKLMLALDILDRLMGYLIRWQQTNSFDAQVNGLLTMIELNKNLAPMLGFIPKEEHEKVIRQAFEEAMKQAQEQIVTGEPKEQKKTVIDLFLERIADKVAEGVADRITQSQEFERYIQYVKALSDVHNEIEETEQMKQQLKEQEQEKPQIKEEKTALSEEDVKKLIQEATKEQEEE